MNAKARYQSKSFVFEPDAAKIQNKVRQLIRELLLIEEKSRNLKLDQIGAISIYFGGDQDHLDTAKMLQDKWLRARTKLMASVEKVLGTSPASTEFSVINEEWLGTLRSFRQISDELNSTVTLQALDNLKKSFT